MSSFYLQLRPIQPPQAARSNSTTHLRSQNTQFIRRAIRANTDALRANETYRCAGQWWWPVVEERAALRACGSTVLVSDTKISFTQLFYQSYTNTFLKLKRGIILIITNWKHHLFFKYV